MIFIDLPLSPALSCKKKLAIHQKYILQTLKKKMVKPLEKSILLKKNNQIIFLN